MNLGKQKYEVQVNILYEENQSEYLIDLDYSEKNITL